MDKFYDSFILVNSKFNLLKIKGQILDMKDVYQESTTNSKGENFLVWAHVYLPVEKFYKLSNP